MRSLEGRNLGAYRLIEQVGIGGMAIIYKAYDPGLDRYVAIKILPEYLGHDAEFSNRFRTEARNVAKLNHPNILPIFGYGEEDGLSYFVMGLVEGGTLKDLMGAPMPAERAVPLVVQVAAALQYAHDLKIVHRDVKPGNVLMSRPDWPLLSDFGIARVLEQQAHLTHSAFLGTPHYMAPEQARGAEITPRTDQYALGIVLYEMVTGAPPYQADTPQAVVYQHIYSALPLPRDRNPAISPSLERVILKALAKEPADRYPDMAAFAGATQAALANPSSVPAGPAPNTTSDTASAYFPSQRATNAYAPLPAAGEAVPPGHSTERIAAHSTVPPVSAVQPVTTEQAAQPPSSSRPGLFWIAGGVAGLIAVLAAAFFVLQAGGAGSGTRTVTVIGPPSVVLPGLTAHDVPNDADVATVTPTSREATLNLKPGQYELQFASGSKFPVPYAVAVAGADITIRLAQVSSFLRLAAASGGIPPLSLQTVDGREVASLGSGDLRSGVWVPDSTYMLAFADGSGYNGKLRISLAGRRAPIELSRRMSFVTIISAPGHDIGGVDVYRSGNYSFSIPAGAGGRREAIPPGTYLFTFNKDNGYANSITVHAKPGTSQQLDLGRHFGTLLVKPISNAPLPDIGVYDKVGGSYLFTIPAVQSGLGVLVSPGTYALDLTSAGVYLDQIPVTINAASTTRVNLATVFGRLKIKPFPGSAVPAFDVHSASGASLHSVTSTAAIQDLYLLPGRYSLTFNDPNAYYPPAGVAITPRSLSTLDLGSRFGKLSVVADPANNLGSVDVKDSAGTNITSASTVGENVFLPPGHYSLVFNSSASDTIYADPLSVSVHAKSSNRLNLHRLYASFRIPSVANGASLSYAWPASSGNQIRTVDASTTRQTVYVLPGRYSVSIRTDKGNRIATITARAGTSTDLPAK